MNITQTNVDELNAVIKLEVKKSDYELKVANALAAHRKKANIDGFRPGHAPVGMIKKMYGLGVIAEEVNKIISENLYKYIYEKNLNVLGEPLPSITDQKPVDFEKDVDFEFAYDIAFAPVFEVKMSKRDKIQYYKIKVSEKMLDEKVAQYARMYGSNAVVDTVEANTEMLKGVMVQVDENGAVAEGGIMNDNTAISLEFMKDEESLAKFKGAKVGDVIKFNPVVAYPNKADFAAMLNITKEEAENVTADFTMKIVEINRFSPSEINEDLFEKACAGKEVKDEAGFRAIVSEEIAATLVNDSDYKFSIDAKAKFVKKCDITLPETFLKRWIIASNKEVTAEQVEKEFPQYADDIKWQIIKSKIVSNNDLKVSEEDVREVAKEFARMQMQQYGLTNLPDEHLNGFVDKILESEKERKSIVDKASEIKIMNHIKGAVKLDEKEIEVEDFNKMFE
ncbi:MAG: trigger factor [Marinifilaceae bacterium]